MNIRNDADREKLIARGWVWVTVTARGPFKGTVISRHRKAANAQAEARGKDRVVVEVSEGGSF